MSENNKKNIFTFTDIEMPTVNTNVNNTNILKTNYINNISNNISNNINNNISNNDNDIYKINIKKPFIEFNTVPEEYIINMPLEQSPKQINDIEANIDIEFNNEPSIENLSDPYDVYVHNLCSQNVEEQINNCLDYVEQFFISCANFTKQVFNDICNHSYKNNL